MVGLNRCCANVVQIWVLKKVKVLKISTLTLAFVGITGLEPATSRPPDVCATNCAKSRSFCLASDLKSDLRVQSYALSSTFANFTGTFFAFSPI